MFKKQQQKNPKNKKPWHWTGEMIALWLRVIAALTEEPTSVTRTHRTAEKPSVIPVPGDITPSFSM